MENEKLIPIKILTKRKLKRYKRKGYVLCFNFVKVNLHRRKRKVYGIRISHICDIPKGCFIGISEKAFLSAGFKNVSYRIPNGELIYTRFFQNPLDSSVCLIFTDKKEYAKWKLKNER